MGMASGGNENGFGVRSLPTSKLYPRDVIAYSQLASKTPMRDNEYKDSQHRESSIAMHSGVWERGERGGGASSTVVEQTHCAVDRRGFRGQELL